jgi:hypothetical protein
MIFGMGKRKKGVLPKSDAVVVWSCAGDQSAETVGCYSIRHDVDVELPLVFGGDGHAVRNVARVDEVLSVFVGGERVGQRQGGLATLAHAEDAHALFPPGRDERALELDDDITATSRLHAGQPCLPRQRQRLAPDSV